MRIFDIFEEKEGKYYTEGDKTYFVARCTAIASCDMEDGESARQEAVFVALMSDDSSVSDEECVYFNHLFSDLKSDDDIEEMLRWVEDAETDSDVLETIRA